MYRHNDTAGKYAARGWIYSQLSRTELYGGKHIVIASRECGDIKFLLKIGVKAKDIIACDIDYIARIKARELGVILSPFPRIEDTVPWAIRKFGPKKIKTINVDLCFTLNNSLPIVDEIYERMTNRCKAHIFLTFMRGRDRMYSDQERMDMLGHGEELPHYNYQSFSRTNEGSPMCVVWVY